MTSHITRRDFIDGFARAVVAGGAGASFSQNAAGMPGTASAPYPPGRTGYVGGRPEDFAIAHGVRDGRRYDLNAAPVSEHYDVVVIGAGLGGLASAHYLHRARPKARILILDNHDEFGGHARRNEFNVGGRFLLGYGGSESLDSPRRRWSQLARDCVASIGVDLDRLNQAYHTNLYPDLGLSFGLFFNRELYGTDRLVTGDPVRSVPTDIPAARQNARAAAAFVADWPIDEQQRARVLDLLTGRRDVLAGHDHAAKRRLLNTTSYHDYLARYFGLDAGSLAMFDGRTLDLFAGKSVMVPASYAWATQYPGFAGLGLSPPAEAQFEDEPYINHFPDGNASLARLFVRGMIPGVAPGQSMEDIVTARFDYGRLDVEGQAVRLRLAATAVALGNTATGAEVLYAQGDKLTRVSAGHVVYAGYSAMVPYICQDLGAEQRAALAQQVKAPLCYVNVAVRNWQAWVKQGVHFVNTPNGFFCNMKLDYPVSLGSYRFPTHPDEPMIVHLVHVPWIDGTVTDLRAQNRQDRRQLYARTFAEFEAHARDELTRVLGPGGFDADRDIAAITVNRWGHGYSYEPLPLFDPPSAERAVAISAAPLGRIHFAGTDAVWEAYADRAIDSAHRAAGQISG
jgi:spermidine dehydrogenase